MKNVTERKIIEKLLSNKDIRQGKVMVIKDILGLDERGASLVRQHNNAQKEVILNQNTQEGV